MPNVSATQLQLLQFWKYLCCLHAPMSIIQVLFRTDFGKQIILFFNPVLILVQSPVISFQVQYVVKISFFQYLDWSLYAYLDISFFSLQLSIFSCILMLERKRMKLGNGDGENPGKSMLPLFFPHGSIFVGFSSVHKISLNTFPYRKMRRIVPYNRMMIMDWLWCHYPTLGSLHIITH